MFQAVTTRTAAVRIPTAPAAILPALAQVIVTLPAPSPLRKRKEIQIKKLVFTCLN